MDTATPPPATVAPSRLWSLDVLRGLCALVVFFSHWQLWSDFTPHGRAETFVQVLSRNCYDAFAFLAWPNGGNHPAVIGFFVLSGFCIHYPFEQRARLGSVTFDWRDHYRRRFWRIMPVYWVAALLGLAVVAAEAWRPAGGDLLALHAAATPADIALRFTALYALIPREVFVGNITLNTVAVEMVIYAAYPWFHRWAMRGGWVRLGAVFVGLQLAGIGLLRFVAPYWVFPSVFMLGLFWYLGALAAHLYVTRRLVVRGHWVLVAWLVFLLLKFVPSFYGLNVIKQNVWGFVCLLLMLWGLRLEMLWPQSRTLPTIAALRYSGQISYSLYAVHTPAMLLATWALAVTGHRNYPLQLAATFIASVLATLAVHYGIERVFYRPRSVATPSLTAVQNTLRPA